MFSRKVLLLLCLITIDGLAQSINPYHNNTPYINPDYVVKVNQFFAENPSFLLKAQQLNLIDEQQQWKVPTAIWIDSKAAILGQSQTHGIYWHLENAYKNGGQPSVVTFVVYDLPGRDCAAFSSNGEIKIKRDKTGQPDVNTALLDYKNNYIDPLWSEITRFYTAHPDAQQKVKLSLIIEPDSLPNMITNTAVNDNYPNSCQFIAEKHVYERGIRYALAKFSQNTSIPVSLYLDIAHSGWLGWRSNANKIASIYNHHGDSSISNYPYAETEGGLGRGFDSIRGFISNTANYTPVNESFRGISEKQYEIYSNYNNGFLSSQFYEWNDAPDEATFLAEIWSLDNSSSHQLQFAGNNDHKIVFPRQGQYYANLHFLIDTSRNGWQFNQGQPHLDGRHHRGNWCNNAMSALGNLPEASPRLQNPLYQSSQDPADYQWLPMDAYVWIKPPGESDGNYDPITFKGDKMCGPTTGDSHNGNNPTDALQDESGKPAPPAGDFFAQFFRRLIDHALS